MRFVLGFIISLLSINLTYADKIFVNEKDIEISLTNRLYIYEDKTTGLNVDDIRTINFDLYKGDPYLINLGHSRSAYWFKFTIVNTSDERLYYILAIENSNLDELNVYEYNDNVLLKKTEAGESKPVSTRDIYHRNYLIRSQLKPLTEYTYYIRVVNNGDELTIPIKYQMAEPYFSNDEKQTLILGLFNGLFIMIVIFTLYLYARLREKLYLYYSLYVALSALFVLGGDGFLSFIFAPAVALRIRLTFVHFSFFFLILFTQSFYKSTENNFHFPWYFNFLKIVSVICALLSFLPYPYRLSSIYIGTVTAPVTFLTVALVSFILYKKEYYTSFYSLAFVFSLSAVIVYLLYDYGMFQSNFITKNSIRLGKALEGVFLTIAVVERFKFNENISKQEIKERSIKIESQKEALQRVNQELEKLSIVASETDNAIAIFDKDTDIEWCNTAFERLYENNLEGIKKEYGKGIKDLSNSDTIEETINECLHQKRPLRYQSKRILKNGNIIWTQTTLSPYLDINGNLVKIISIDTNITQLKEVQQELIKSRDKAEESDKLKSAFLSNISHEIRTPLNAILGFSDLLMMDKVDSKEKQKKYLGLVRSNGRHLLKLISDIIDISRIEAGEIKLDLFKGNINKLMDELFTHFTMEVATGLSKNVELVVKKDLDDASSNIFSDHHKIRQVLTNLLGNAAKFTLEGTIEYGYIIEGKFIKFYVTDTGIGIEPEQQKVIFERFRQVELGLSRKYEGAGLGLSLSKGLVEKMGGKIWVESVVGKGSGFFFTVPYEPLGDEKLIIYKKEEIHDYNFKGKKVLIVEDTEPSRELIFEMLEDTGIEIDEAVNGNQALEMSFKKLYDVILMDIRLPDINGYEVTKRIKEREKNIFIIAQTANAMDDERSKCFEAGCDEYITKPFDSETLLGLINTHLRNK